MLYTNKLDIEGLKRLGISFNTEKETERFASFIKERFETRVGEGISKTLSKEKIKQFENTPDSEQPMWIKDNCPQYREIYEECRKEFKDELLKYRYYIPGVKKIYNWEILSIDCLDLLPLRYFKKLKETGIDTLGELNYIDDDTLGKILDIWSSGETKRVIEEIREMMGNEIDGCYEECIEELDDEMLDYFLDDDEEC